jgi:hypothetical protein
LLFVREFRLQNIDDAAAAHTLGKDNVTPSVL